MHSVNEYTRKALEKAEIDMLAWQTFTRVKRGDTFQQGGNYAVMVNALHDRAEYLESQIRLQPEDHNDWLALALFADDRPRFLALWECAAAINDPTHARAARWLNDLIGTELNRHKAQTYHAL